LAEKKVLSPGRKQIKPKLSEKMQGYN